MSELLTLLGVHPESRVSLLGIRDAEFLRAILPNLLNPSQHRAAYQSDFIFLGVESPQQLKRLSPLKKYLNPHGSFWIVYPNHHSLITPSLILAALDTAGLTASDSIPFSSTHTALHATLPA